MKEVLTSITSKVTRQRFHARFKAPKENKNVNNTNSNVERNRNNRAKSRNLSPPKAATGIYSSKKTARSTTVAPKIESTTVNYKRSYPTRNSIIEQVVSTSEVRLILDNYLI